MREIIIMQLSSAFTFKEKKNNCGRLKNIILTMDNLRKLNNTLLW